MEGTDPPRDERRPSPERLGSVCRILLDLGIDSDLSPGTDDFENEDAERASIGVRFHDIDHRRRGEIARHLAPVKRVSTQSDPDA